MKITIKPGPPGGRPLITMARLVLAEDLTTAYDDYKAIEELAHLRDAEGIRFVGGEGAVDAPIMVIGEAPGRMENEEGRPFVGPAGALLRKQLLRVGLTLNEVYLTNVVKYRPENNRPPLYFEVELSRPCIEREIEIVNPELIILAGRTPLSLLWHNAPISAHEGKPEIHEGRMWLPIYHPSAALREDRYMQAFKASFDLIETMIHD